jgi:plasmid stability protein
MIWEAYMGNYYLRNIPDNLREAFRILCVREKVSMNKKLKELMAEQIRKSDSEKMRRESYDDHSG